MNVLSGTVGLDGEGPEGMKEGRVRDGDFAVMAAAGRVVLW
jgi:hypothetical protein